MGASGRLCPGLCHWRWPGRFAGRLVVIVKVEKNVPIPNRYPFDEMQVGDSFAVPPETTRTAVAVAAGRFGEKHQMKFIVRLMPDKTLRCWRTE